MIKNHEYISDFLGEASEHLETMDLCLQKIKQNVDDKEIINNIFRAAHTIKGTASFLGLKNIVDLAHALEDVFSDLRSGSIKIYKELYDALLSATDCLKSMVDDISNIEDYNIKAHVEILENISIAIKEELAMSNNSSKVENDIIGKEGNNKDEISVETKVSGKTIEEKNCNKPDSNEDTIDSDKICDLVNKKNRFEDTIRVNVLLLNDILDLASEMVLARNQLLTTFREVGQIKLASESILQKIDHITTALQGKVMKTRMQPISDVFNKLPRLVREVSKVLNKKIDLSIDDNDIELDKSIIETLFDPLIHILRNSIDHGIESAEIRRNEGKPANATITIKVYNEGGYVNIDIKDDGRGIDIEGIKQKAINMGMGDTISVNSMSDSEVLKLIFIAGFSTAKKVTDISGRGVGLDVVKSNIEKIGGTIEVYTNAGKGTTFRLILPMTLAIISSLIVEIESQKFALPQMNIQEIVRIKPDEIPKKIEEINNFKVLRLRNNLLPIVHLADILEIRRTFADENSKKRKYDCRRTLQDRRRNGNLESKFNRRNKDRRMNEEKKWIIVLHSGNKRFGLMVDTIHEGEEILVKQVPEYFKECICYSGVTILGDGKIVMILDVEGIITKANFNFNEEGQIKKEFKKNNLIENRKIGDMLLFDCSEKEIIGVDLSMVSRIEKIKTQDVIHMGNRDYIKYKGSVLLVYRPEDILPISKCEYQKDYQYLIIPKIGDKAVGILVRDVVDNITTELEVNNREMQEQGIRGTINYEDNIILVIDMKDFLKKAELLSLEKEKINV